LTVDLGCLELIWTAQRVGCRLSSSYRDDNNPPPACTTGCPPPWTRCRLWKRAARTLLPFRSTRQIGSHRASSAQIRVDQLLEVKSDRPNEECGSWGRPLVAETGAGE